MRCCIQHKVLKVAKLTHVYKQGPYVSTQSLNIAHWDEIALECAALQRL